VTSAIKPPEASLVATETGHRVSYEGTGYGFILWPYAFLVIGLACATAYGLAVDSLPNSVTVAVFCTCLFAAMIALLIYAAKEYTASVELTKLHITKSTVFGKRSLNWTEIDRVTFAPRSYAILLHAKTGQTMRLPRFNGCEADLERCLRHYIPKVEFS
jgi:hypothetical protein